MKVSNLNSYMIGKKLSPFQSDLSAAFFRLEGDTIEYRATDFRSRFRCFSAYDTSDMMALFLYEASPKRRS